MKIRRGLIAFTLAFTSTGAFADIWGDAWKAATAPITAPIQILQGQPPEKVMRQQIYNHGQVIQDAAQVAQQVNDQITRIPRDAVRANLGNDWLAAYDTLTADQRIQTEMATTSGRFLGGCLKGQPCNINQLVAMPVAAALRESYKVYIGQSMPLSPQLQLTLSRVYPAQLLPGLRIAFGAIPNFTAPGFINAGNQLFGSENAVTIGNLMIFSRPPDLRDPNDWVWLLHEMHHVEQYAAYSPDVLESIDGFAVDYTYHYNSMEADARNTASARWQNLQQSCSLQAGC